MIKICTQDNNIKKLELSEKISIAHNIKRYFYYHTGDINKLTYCDRRAV